MSKKYTLLTFKGICINFLQELKFFILSHPREIVQLHMHHPVVQTQMVKLMFLYQKLKV